MEVDKAEEEKNAEDVDQSKADADKAKDDAPAKKVEELNEEDKARQDKIEKLSQILSGNKTIYLHLQFLMRNDHSDLQILNKVGIHSPFNLVWS